VIDLQKKATRVAPTIQCACGCPDEPDYTVRGYNLNVRHTPNPSQEGNPNRSNFKGVEFPSGEGLGVCQKGK